MTHRPLQFGIHDFLNSRPLLKPLRAQSAAAGWKIRTDTPAGLAAQLEDGKLDLALIPSFEYLRNADRYLLFPDFAISSRGAVRTVLLALKPPIENATRIAVDERSRTSIRLLRLLFQERFPKTATYHPAPPDADTMLAHHDAALVIGDEALHLQARPDLEIFDLSEEWFRKTGRTFVHAVLAVRDGVTLTAPQNDAIRNSKETARQHIPAVARDHSARSGIDVAVCCDYLENKIIYNLREEEVAGLIHFRDACIKNEWLAETLPIRWTA
jgi:chorismate dehydratase